MEDETEAEGEEKDTEEAVEILCEPDTQSASHSRHNSGHTRRNRKTEEVSQQHLLKGLFNFTLLFNGLVR